MNTLPLALSISNTFTKVGAIAAFAGLLGIAVLSLLVFSQAREIRRLREWAGRAPERAAEAEQRVSADAAARLQRGPTPPVAAGTRVAAGARVVPRKTPLVSAPVSTSVHATASAAAPAAGGTPAPAVATAPEAGAAPVATDPNAAPAAVEAKTEEPAPEAPPQTPAPLAERSVAAEAEPEPAKAPESPAPATAAAVARSPLPPSPAAPSPAARRTPSRTVAVADKPVPAPRTTARPPVGESGPKYFKQESSPARAVVLVVGGLIVVVLALVFAVSALKGGGGGSPAASTPAQSTSEASRSLETHASTRTTASSPTDTTVTVLNGTGTAGLAHHLASDLQQSGYSQAAASSAVPQGTHPTTVVEYTHGHRAEAQAVARSLNVGQVQSIDSSTAALAGSATVVVLAGADQAALLGGGSAQSQGEPATAP